MSAHSVFRSIKNKGGRPRKADRIVQVPLGLPRSEADALIAKAYALGKDVSELARDYVRLGQRYEQRIENKEVDDDRRAGLV